MPGPMPKPLHMRQRRNKASTSKELVITDSDILKFRHLPPGDSADQELGWHPITIEWWNSIFESSHNEAFLTVDFGSLIRLAFLVDAFWRGDVKLAPEIRLLEREFGLTPLSRRRLEWTTVEVEEKIDRLDERRFKTAKIINDPRGALE